MSLDDKKQDTFGNPASDVSTLDVDSVVEARDDPPSAHTKIPTSYRTVKPDNPESPVPDVRNLFKISFHNKICTSTTISRETLNEYYYKTDLLKQLLPHLDIDNLIYKPGRKQNSIKNEMF